MAKKRVAVLISGRGSNMAALVEAARTPDYPAEIALVAQRREDDDGYRVAFAAQHAEHLEPVAARQYDVEDH